MTGVPPHGFPVGVPGYQSLGWLGQGASGQVFKARQRSTGQWVAIKIPHPPAPGHSASSRRVQQRLHQETRVLALLQHPHVVRLIDKGMAAGGLLFAVLEFIPGQTLRDFLLHHGPLSLADTLVVMAQLLDALACLHAHHIVHRDLKPENIMVLSTGAALHAKLLDFGLASHRGEPLFAGGAEGTPAYCAPEQLRGECCVAATDLYAWALVFLECLSARPCLQGASFNEVLRQQLSPSAIVLPDMVMGHPLEPLLRRALHKDVHQRASDAARLQGELLQCLAPLRGAGQAPRVEVFALARGAWEGTAQLLTLDTLPAPVDAAASGGRALVILCVALHLYPAKNASVALSDLQEIRAQQMQWCANAVHGGQGQSAGVLGDCMLFHFEQEPSSAQNLHQAAVVALDLCTRVQRRSRMLEVQHGVRVDVSGGMHTVTLASCGDTSGRNLGTNVALYLNHLAEPGTIVASRCAHHELAGSVRLEEYRSAARGHQGVHDAVFRLVADPPP